ncbi:MAG TPA: hypothetical protein VFV96_18390 [Verrucomicrobiae bacterium]|nr:hypothetical protein [Verrucomicrobiae bacterium]
MNETPISPGSEDLKETCATLRHQLNSVLILLLVVSATMTIFFLRQVSLARKDIESMRPVITGYQTNTGPAIQEFTRKLQEYAKTHPDVVPILVKYGVVQVGNPSAATTAPRK